MSLLMEALKQQQAGPTAPNAASGYAGGETGQPNQGQGWKILALVLLVLVGLLAGFLLLDIKSILLYQYGYKQLTKGNNERETKNKVKK